MSMIHEGLAEVDLESLPTSSVLHVSVSAYMQPLMFAFPHCDCGLVLTGEDGIFVCVCHQRMMDI